MYLLQTIALAVALLGFTAADSDFNIEFRKWEGPGCDDTDLGSIQTIWDRQCFTFDWQFDSFSYTVGNMSYDNEDINPSCKVTVYPAVSCGAGTEGEGWLGADGWTPGPAGETLDQCHGVPHFLWNWAHSAGVWCGSEEDDPEGLVREGSVKYNSYDPYEPY